MARLRVLLEDSRQIAVGGEQFTVRDGVVSVPDRLVEEMLRHPTLYQLLAEEVRVPPPEAPRPPSPPPAAAAAPTGPREAPGEQAPQKR